VRYNIGWRAPSNFITLGGDLFFEDDQESGRLVDEHLRKRYGGGISLGYQFNAALGHGALRIRGWMWIS